MRIGLIALLHESNTFAAEPTSLESFRRDVFVRGSDVIEIFQGAHQEMGGFIAGLLDRNETPVGVFAARALPSGTITADTHDALVQEMLSSLQVAGPLDGILVAPHGATVSQNYRDADGMWLSKLREVVGPDMPIIGTLDPHANLSPAMVAATNALIAYKTNPHIDQFDRGYQAACLMVDTVAGKVAPKQAAAFPPLAFCIERQCSNESPARELLDEFESARQARALLDVSLFYGFPYADVSEMGSAVLCVSDGDEELARQSSQELASLLWQQRDDTAGRYCDIPSAIEKALKLQGPVCLLDMGDNIGAGSAADGTWIAHALLEREVGRSFVALCDAEAVSRVISAGHGNHVELSIGGKRSEFDGLPLEDKFYVQSLHSGKYSESEARHGGKTEFDMGPTAIVRSASGLTIQITTHRTAPWSLGQLTHCDLDPMDFQIIVAKGVNAPLAAYQAVCPNFIRVDTPGTTTANMEHLTFTNRRRPMFPFERECTYPE